MNQTDFELIYGKHFANSSKKSGCISEAFKLIKHNGNGKVYMVYEMCGIPINHAYYIPEFSKYSDKALNQSDNGFEGFPELSVEQVIKHGKILDSENYIAKTF
ncbi:MAG: hypothetical protein ACOYT4_05310 [Nanoarchaeota archaeon]